MKIVKFLLFIIIIIFILFTLFWFLDFILRPFVPATQPTYGATFSINYARYLGLNPQEAFEQTLTDMQIKKVRLPVYWEDIEKEQGKYDFSDYDKLLDLAGKNQAKVILALGYKVPRWPECFVPSWGSNLDRESLEKSVLAMLETSMIHFKNRPEIIAWQIENEPLLDFGKCQLLGEPFLKEEVALAKNLDSRPIVLTDSGELGLWVTALKYSDLMGTSLYRIVWNPVFGFFHYPFPPLYYNLKAKVTKAIFAPESQGVFISELQTEPWSPGKSIPEISLDQQIDLFTLDNFKEVVEFTRWTRIKDQYLWGIEWWYYMKIHGHPEYWEYAKNLFQL